MRPSPLLRFIRGVSRRKLSWCHDLLHELRPVTREKVPETQLAILDKARGAPAAGGLDGGGSPDACRAGEVDKPPHGGAPRHLQRMVVVNPERLRKCQERLVMVQVAPLSLHERKAGVGLAAWDVEVWNGAKQKVLGRHEVCVEDCEELCVRLFATLLERASLVALTNDAVPHVAVHTCGFPNSGADIFDERPRVLVGGVIEHLHAEAVSRPGHLARRLNDTLRHCMLVEHGKLHAYGRIHRR